MSFMTTLVTRRRRGFALLTVLWVMTAGSVLAAAGVLAGRQGAHAARNRVNSARALWRAEDCLARAHATIDEQLSEARTPDAESATWRALDSLPPAPSLPMAEGCAVVLRAAGSTLDVNAAESEQLARLFTAAYGAPPADGLVDALLDWRDADDEPRPEGAEADWYRTQRRHVPRNDSIAAVGELARIRGFEELAGLGDLLGVEPGRISIANAPAAVLLAVPGFTEETVAAILERRFRGEQVTSLLALAKSLSPRSADSLIARYPDIERLTALEPDAWILTSEGAVGDPIVRATIEVRLVRAGRRAVVLRRRISR
jgi:type II secretory pathway component PulK